MSRVSFLSLLLCAALSELGCTDAVREPAARVSENTAAVDRIFARWNSDDSAGCAVGVVRDGRIVLQRSYGMASIEHGVPITGKTVFDIASNSKQFTAMAVLMLASDGWLSIDDEVQKFIPELPVYQWPVTLRHLLHHTSGLRDYVDLLDFAGTHEQDLLAEAEALTILTRQKELNFRPGTTFLYNNSGYFLLGIIVKRVSGMSLAEFARARIFAALHMTQTEYLDNHARVVARRATGYREVRAGSFEVAMSNWEPAGDGQVQSSVEDLVLWSDNLRTGAVGGRAVLDAMLAPGQLSSGERLEYGAGLMLFERGGDRTVRHGGTWAGYRAEVMHVPERRLSVIWLCNIGNARRALPDEVLRAILVPIESATHALGDEEAATMVGSYRHSETGLVHRIERTKDGLFINALGAMTPLPYLGGGHFTIDSMPMSDIVRVPSTTGRRMIREKLPIAWLGLEEIPTVAPPVDGESLAGIYRCDDLATDFTIVALNGKLEIRRPRFEPADLTPTIVDEFDFSGNALQLTRGKDGAVSGFLLSSLGTWRLRFRRI